MKLVGVDHVGSADFDVSETHSDGLKACRRIELIKVLLDRGYADSDRKDLSGNVSEWEGGGLR